MDDPLQQINRRLDAMERRLASLEKAVHSREQPSTGKPQSTPAPSKPAPRSALQTAAASPSKGTGASSLMAWGAGFAFVLAAVYFVKLVYDSGWLTPERQVGLAILGGIALIAGLGLERRNRDYAAYLPAAGTVVLYVAIYAAHAYYQMVGAGAVIFGVGVTTLASIWLHRHFDNTVFALFAVAGAYAFPLFIRAKTPDVTDMVIYFGAWSLLFSFVALQEGRRTIYLLAMYFAVIGFDLTWRQSSASGQWAAAAVYQFIQFGVFAVSAAVFSIRYRTPMSREDARWHGGALFYFYIVEFILLKQHIPLWAPLIALGSALAVLALFIIARNALRNEAALSASGVLVSAYCSVVTTHIVFFELLPGDYVPWAALAGPAALAAMRPVFREQREAMTPVALAAGFLFVIGLFRLLVSDTDSSDIPLPNIALFAYAGVLYLAQRAFRAEQRRRDFSTPMLYAGHVAFMVATVKTFDSALAISLVWGLFAVALLILAIRLRDRVLGQSSLIIFAASGVKVLLYDLTGTPSLVRVGTLIVLGVSLYAGGWLYQQMLADADGKARTQ